MNETAGMTLEEILPKRKEKDVIANIKAIIQKETKTNPHELRFVEEHVGKSIHFVSQEVGKYKICLLKPLLITSGTDIAQLKNPVSIFRVRGKAELSTELNEDNSSARFRPIGDGRVSLESQSKFSLRFITTDFLVLIIHRIKR